MNHKHVVATKAADDLKHGATTAGHDVRRVVLDLETTGLEPDDRITEIGGVEMIGREPTGRTFHHYLNPERLVGLSECIHGLSDEFLADKPKFAEVTVDFMDFVRGAELVLHNAEFDATYLNHELALLKLPPLETVVVGLVDTLKMARAIRPGLKNNINALCADYQLDIPRRQYHGALLDAHMLAKIYLAMTRHQQELSTMSLLEQIELRWAEVQTNGYMADKWAKTLADSQENLLKAAKTFHQWAPLEVYLSVSRATKQPRVAFSLRYQGQHVANLLVDLLAGGNPQLEIDKKTATTNENYFEIDLEGTFGWRDEEAKEFRKHFKNLGPEPRGRSPEHRIEAIFLEQMANSTSEKFNGTLKNIQPVLFAGCPLQLPVPISGNTGMPEAKRGNIDIVARRRVGNRTRLSIWELKRPEVTAHAIEQAYIYGVTVLKMLRAEESGHIWYKDVLGFNGKMPDRMTIECVIAVSLDDIKEAEALGKLRRFVTENSLQIEGDTIEFYLANYAEEQGSLSIGLTKA